MFEVIKMRVLTIVIVFLFTFAAASAQSKFALKPQGELRIDDYDDRIITERLLPSENKLLLVGQKNIRLWDLATAKQVAVTPIDVPGMKEDQPRVISPSGRFMVVFGNYNSHDKADKIKKLENKWRVLITQRNLLSGPGGVKTKRHWLPPVIRLVSNGMIQTEVK